MERGIDGGIVIGAQRCRGADTASPDTDARHIQKTAEEMTMRSLKAQLCSIACLKRCKSCRLCAYGKEYVRRLEESGKG